MMNRRRFLGLLAGAAAWGTAMTVVTAKQIDNVAPADSLKDGADKYNAHWHEDARGHIFGLTLSNNGTDATNDIDVAVGDAFSDDALIANTVHMALTTALTKQLDVAWAVGTNAGMLDTGVVGNGTYHVFLIKRTDTNVVDILASLSATAPTMPTNYTKRRRIMSILRESAANVAFVQDGDYVRRKASAFDVDVTNPGTTAVLRTLSIPAGLKLLAIVQARITQGANDSSRTHLSDPDANDEAPAGAGAPLITLGGVLTEAQEWATRAVIRSNTSRQIRTRVETSNAGTVLRIATLGWFDRRGQDA